MSYNRNAYVLMTNNNNRVFKYRRNCVCVNVFSVCASDVDMQRLLACCPGTVSATSTYAYMHMRKIADAELSLSIKFNLVEPY